MLTSAQVVARTQQFPRLRYMGSKYRLVPHLERTFADIGGTTAIDAFSGSGVVSYLLKNQGYQVTSNDYLHFPGTIARATVANSSVRLDDELVDQICGPPADDRDFIQSTFDGLYFSADDRAFLDSAWSHIDLLTGYRRDLAIAALVLSAARKQPRGVFTFTDSNRYADGRRDLRLTLREHFRERVAEYNATVFSNGARSRAVTGSVLRCGSPRLRVSTLSGRRGRSVAPGCSGTRQRRRPCSSVPSDEQVLADVSTGRGGVGAETVLVVDGDRLHVWFDLAQQIDDALPRGPEPVLARGDHHGEHQDQEAREAVHPVRLQTHHRRRVVADLRALQRRRGDRALLLLQCDPRRDPSLTVQVGREYGFGDVLVARAGTRVTATRAGASGRKVEDEIEAIAAGLDLTYRTRTRFTGRNGRTAPCDLVIPDSDDAIVVAAKGFDSTGSKLTDAVREILEMAEIRLPRQFVIAVIDGIGWKSRQADLRRIHTLWTTEQIDGMYTLATLDRFREDLAEAARIRRLM